MNIKEVKKIVLLDILIIVFAIFCFIFSLVMILTDNVSAATVSNNVNAYITSSCGTQNGTNAGYCSSDAFGNFTRRYLNNTYSGQAYNLELIVPYNTSNTNPVTIIIDFMSNDFRNSQYLVDSLLGMRSINSTESINYTFSVISRSRIQFLIDDSSLSSIRYFMISLNGQGRAITGDTNFGIKKITMSWNDGVTDNTDVINNANQNAQNTIDAMTDNFQTTFDILDNLMRQCYDMALPITPGISNMYLADRGVETSNNDYYITKYIGVKPGQSYLLNIRDTNNNAIRYGRYCWYDKDRVLLSCGLLNAGTNVIEYNLTSPVNALYFRSTIYKNAQNPFLQGTICTSIDESIQDTNNSINNVNNSVQEQTDYLKDDSDPSINDSALDGALSSVEYNDPLNYLLVLPFNLIAKINLVLSQNTCQPVRFGNLYGTELGLPCIDIESKIGSTLYNTIDIFMAIGLLAVTLKKFYDSISNILTLGKEQEVKNKLELPTPMEFLAMIFGGGN